MAVGYHAEGCQSSLQTDSRNKARTAHWPGAGCRARNNPQRTVGETEGDPSGDSPPAGEGGAHSDIHVQAHAASPVYETTGSVAPGY